MSVKRDTARTTSPQYPTINDAATIQRHHKISFTCKRKHQHHLGGTTAITIAKMADNTYYNTWTPEQLMRDYHGELKRELFMRCMEWYTNSEVEAKINANRPDGTNDIKNSNFYAEFKRNLDIVALRDGHLPTEYKLMFDKRRLSNLEARFGSEQSSVRALKKSVERREAIGCKFLTLEWESVSQWSLTY